MDNAARIANVVIGDAFPGDIAQTSWYVVSDHLGCGTLRLSTAAGGTVIDREEYYPFGDSSLRTFSKKRYRYVGKEKDSESGLYYYGARYYAAWTGRFVSVDPLADKYPFYTPYNYAGNKPIGKIDIDGMQEEGKAQAPVNNGNNSPPAKGEESAKTLPEVIVIGTATAKEIGADATKELAEEAAKTATENGGRSLVPKKTFWGRIGGLLRGFVAAIALELFTSTEDNEALVGLYKTAKEKNFEDEDVNQRFANELAIKEGGTDFTGEGKEEKPDLVYRSGRFNKSTFTPRPGIDDRDDLPPTRGGLSTFRTPEQAVAFSKDKKKIYQALDLNVLRKLGFEIIEEPSGHVAIRTPSRKELREWAATRKTEKLHYRTVWAMASRRFQGER